MKISYIAAATMVAIAGLVSSAEASPIDVSGSIAWGSNSPTTSYSAANETSTFSFIVDSQLPATTTASTASITSLQYSLNGVTVTPSSSSATFFDTSAKGMFNLDLTGPGGTTLVSIYGANIGNVDSTWMIGQPGAYPVTAAISDSDPTASGTVTISAVPLPAALPLFGAACAALMAYGLRRKNPLRQSADV